MDKVFYDADNSDSFHLINDDSYEPRKKLEEFVKWLENKMKYYNEKLREIETKGNSDISKEKDMIKDKIDDLNNHVEKVKDKLNDDKEVSKEHLERLVGDAEELIKEINEAMAKFFKMM